jgi:DUF917 family protein
MESYSTKGGHMSAVRLDKRLAEAAVLGGAVLGGGGGGDIQDGLERASLAVRLGSPVLMALDDLDDDDLVITASVVGAPAAAEKFVRPVDHIKALELLSESLPLELAGIIANENGASSGVNGWLQAAAMGIPMIDAPANGRAHPTGLMGAMGIHRLEDYVSVQSAVGGNPETGRYLEAVFKGKLEVTANMVRHASIQAGGIVAVSRDPIDAAYLRQHAAPGGTSQAIEVGEAIMAARDQGANAMIQATVSVLGGRIACQGQVAELRLETVGGYDVGSVKTEGDQQCELTFWNEFMTLEIKGQREATFPDLITLLSLESGLPVSSAEIRQGNRVAVLVVPRDHLILGEGVRLPEAIREAEQAVGKALLKP